MTRQHNAIAPVTIALDAQAGALSSERVNRILATVRQHLGMEIAFVSRYDRDEREFTYISTGLPLPHKPGFREPKAESFWFHILEGRLPGLIHDAADRAFAKTLTITDMLPVGCHLNVPLRFADGAIYGSFCALNRLANRSITQRDMGIMNAFAALAVECIESEVGTDMEETRIRGRIAEVIANCELTILHQPIHSLATGEPIGVECLARFPDADKHGPDVWFDSAASVGMGLERELFAAQCALGTLAHLPAGKYASINASPETTLSGKLHDLLDQGKRERLVVEVTEHARVGCYDALALALRDLKPKARIAIDILKLDMSLTRNVHQDKARHALSGAMVHFAGEIGATLVAEGIECAEEGEAQTRLGVHCGQGYHYARPLPMVRAQRHMLALAAEDGEDGADGADGADDNDSDADGELLVGERARVDPLRRHG